MREFVKSVADFSCALSALAVSQPAKVLNAWPTRDPARAVTEGFAASTTAIEAQLDPVTHSLYNTGKTVQNAVIDLTFNFFSPHTFNPMTVVDTTQNVLRWSAGIATQFIPGGQIGNGGSPVGWGPVKTENAEFLRF
jgi:hypothetical protein